MPRIIVQTHTEQPSTEVTLSERIVAANLDSAHYRRQLIERLAWATADAEELEAAPRRRWHVSAAGGIQALPALRESGSY